ncbi:MAG: BrnT family toxin [Terracidiphilus sp.]|jgi:uncharacterized protein
MEFSNEPSVSGRKAVSLEFDWDDENIRHLALHQITPVEVEQAIANRPVDLKSELRNGEERVPHIGETDAGRILVVVSTMNDKKVRVVTAWPANRNYRRYFLSLKRNGNVGRTETDELRE